MTDRNIYWRTVGFIPDRNGMRALYHNTGNPAHPYVCPVLGWIKQVQYDDDDRNWKGEARFVPATLTDNEALPVNEECSSDNFWYILDVDDPMPTQEQSCKACAEYQRRQAARRQALQKRVVVAA